MYAECYHSLWISKSTVKDQILYILYLHWKRLHFIYLKYSKTLWLLLPLWPGTCSGEALLAICLQPATARPHASPLEWPQATREWSAWILGTKLMMLWTWHIALSSLRYGQWYQSSDKDHPAKDLWRQRQTWWEKEGALRRLLTLSRSLHLKVCPPLVPTPSLTVNSSCSQAYISHRDQAILVYQQQNTLYQLWVGISTTF